MRGRRRVNVGRVPVLNAPPCHGQPSIVPLVSLLIHHSNRASRPRVIAVNTVFAKRPAIEELALTLGSAGKGRRGGGGGGGGGGGTLLGGGDGSELVLPLNRA
jgi:hypothetical protein